MEKNKKRMKLGIASLLIISISVHTSAEKADINIDQESIVQLVKKQQYAYPFADYETFIEFMKESPTAIPPWTDSSLRISFPVSLYEKCADSNQIEFLEVIYQSPNGYTRGWTVRPRITEQPLPVVIFNRGGFAKWGRIFPFELLSLCHVATNGFMVIASDFRGKKESELTGKQDITDLGYGDVKDNYYFIEAIKKQYDDLDNNNIAVWGFSRGTTLAALMATQLENIRLIIMQGMVVDLVNNPRRAEFDEHVFPLIVNNFSELSDLKKDQLLNGISPMQLIDKIKGKPSFLIFHGAKDNRASASQALIYASELLKRKFDTEFHLYNESGHVLSGNFHTYINEVIESLNTHFSKKQKTVK